jgi:hypothetical protein
MQLQVGCSLRIKQENLMLEFALAAVEMSANLPQLLL